MTEIKRNTQFHSKVELEHRKEIEMVGQWILSVLDRADCLARACFARARVFAMCELLFLSAFVSFATQAQITPPWQAGPTARVPCANYVFPSSGSAIGVTPSPAETGKPFSVIYRSFFTPDQYYFETIAGGFRFNVRGTEFSFGLPVCSILASPVLVAPPGGFVVEEALFRDNPVSPTRYNLSPQVTSYSFSSVLPPVPAPIFSPISIVTLIVLILVLVRNRLRKSIF